MLALSALPSCRSVEHCSTVVQNGSELFSIVRSVDTVVVHDSVFVREMIKGDTFYITRVEWRDRWHTRVERDTVVDVRVEKEVVQLPPERYVPRFHKWCTRMFWLIVVATIIYLILRLRIRV
jgi:hypothetical protein